MPIAISRTSRDAGDARGERLPASTSCATFFAGGWGDRPVTRARACQLLRCGEEELDRLRARGLPCWQHSRSQRYGYCDVMNAGLYSDSGRTLAELAARHIARALDPARKHSEVPWTWQLSLTSQCPHGCTVGATPSAPQSSDRVAVLADWHIERDTATSVAWGATVAVHPCSSTVLDERVRSRYAQVLEEFDAGVVSYQYLPQALRRDPCAARALGVADCMTTALTLRSWCEQLKVPSRIRTGYILGLVCVEHVWLEVLDDDCFKPLDPVLTLLVRRSRNDDRAVAADFYLGSLPSCVLPWPVSAEPPLHAARCDHPDATSSLIARLLAAGARRYPYPATPRSSS